MQVRKEVKKKEIGKKKRESKSEHKFSLIIKGQPPDILLCSEIL